MEFSLSLDRPLRVYRAFIKNHVFAILLPASDVGEAYKLITETKENYCYQDSPSTKPKELFFLSSSVIALDSLDDTTKQIKEIKGILELSFYNQKDEKQKPKASVRVALGKSAKKRKKK